jgi:hypothetical protein
MHSIKSQRGHALPHSHTRFEIFDKQAASVLVVALVAGIASYLNNIHPQKPDGPKFNKLALLAHLSACIVASFIVSGICQYFKLDQLLQVPAIGLAGWGGPKIMDWLVYVARAKFLQLISLDHHSKQERHTYDPQQPQQPGYYAPTTPTTVQTPGQQPGAAPAPITAAQTAEVAKVQPAPAHIVIEDSSREARLKRKADAMAAKNNPV